jgi:hypothetical protein
MQPKRKKGAATAEAENDEDESTLIHEEQPAAAPGGSGSEFYFDEGDDYAQYETMAAEPTVAPAPVQVTEEVRLRIEANKRAAEARRAAKAAAAAAEVAAAMAEGQEESAAAAQNQMQQGQQEQQDRVGAGSASNDMFQHELQSEPHLDDREQGEEVCEDDLQGGAQQPCASVMRSGDDETAADLAEAGRVVEANGLAEEEQQEEDGGRSAVCEERGEDETSVFTKPLRSIVIGCSDSVFASLTKRIVSPCCCCFCICCCCCCCC